ncbi:conserved domain protein [Clostridium sp. CAG:1193]|nr:conserved domain protein [Clostridium sp. CAG:1193]
MHSMFENSAATEIKGLENFDTSKVTNMSGMFSVSSATTLDLSSFDTSNVTDMWQMFYMSKATSLDLSSFDTST